MQTGCRAGYLAGSNDDDARRGLKPSVVRVLKELKVGCGSAVRLGRCTGEEGKCVGGEEMEDAVVTSLLG